MNGLGLLAAEALRDAARRRIVLAIAVASLLSLWLVESCTSCNAQVVVDGQVREMLELGGAAGTMVFGVLGLWCVVLAGVLAADHLAETLEDGSAALCLARPVRRETFAAARLAGALGVAGGAGLLLLGATAALLRARSGLPLLPAAWAGLAVAGGAVTVGALAAAASLWLPRVAVVLLVLVFVGLVTLANAFGLAPGEVAGWLAAVDRFGPPLLTALAFALDPWTERVDVEGEGLALALRLLVWSAGALAILLLAFRRVELGR